MCEVIRLYPDKNVKQSLNTELAFKSLDLQINVVRAYNKLFVLCDAIATEIEKRK